MALRNAWTFWFGVTDRQANPWYGGSRYLSVDFIANVVVILFGLAGMLPGDCAPVILQLPFIWQCS